MRIAGQPKAIELISMLLAVDPKPAGEVWDHFFRPKQDYLIDPVVMADAFGTPASRRVVHNTATWEQDLNQRPIDAGAAAIDMLMRRAGVRTNISGFSNPPTVRYPISPDIHYKRQFKPVTGPARRGSRYPGTIVEYVGFTDTPMMDWDTPGPSHVDRNTTVRNLGDVEALAREYVKRHPHSSLRLYQTPGGFRAWEVGERLNPADFQPRFQELQVDPDYAMLSNTGFGRTVQGVPIDPPSFRSRISHKPGRTDWVAQPIATISGSEALLDPRSIALVRAFHDEPIRQRYLGAGGASPAAVQAVKTQARTASQALQGELRRRFGI
jgi:hypothetical protein